MVFFEEKSFVWEIFLLDLTELPTVKSRMRNLKVVKKVENRPSLLNSIKTTMSRT